MDHADQPDFGTGKKKLGIYIGGLLACSLLTLLAFAAVMYGQMATGTLFAVVYGAACIQFIVQLLCFIRLNTQTPQGQMNVMALVFTAVILTSIIVGSLWIMWNLGYNMM